jgi:PilZ domain
MLQQLAPVTHPLPLPGRRLECRVYQRLPCDLAGFCKPTSELGSEEVRWSATARDISQGGIRLQLSRRYEPGAGLAIELPSRAGHDLHTFFAKVIYVRIDADGMWSHGCQFVSPLSQDELKRLLGIDQPDGFFPEDQPHTLPTSNGSDTPENPAAPLQVHFQVDGPAGTLVDCYIKRLTVPKSWPLAAGKAVTIRGGDSAETRWALKVQVLECLQQKERWTLRCRLLHVPAAGEMLRAISSRSRVPVET